MVSRQAKLLEALRKKCVPAPAALTPRDQRDGIAGGQDRVDHLFGTVDWVFRAARCRVQERVARSEYERCQVKRASGSPLAHTARPKRWHVGGQDRAHLFSHLFSTNACCVHAGKVVANGQGTRGGRGPNSPTAAVRAPPMLPSFPSSSSSMSILCSAPCVTSRRRPEKAI